MSKKQFWAIVEQLSSIIFFFQFLQTANRLLHQLPNMERHYQLEGVKGLLQVFCDVVAMLKNQEDTRAMLPSGLTKNVQVGFYY